MKKILLATTCASAVVFTSLANAADGDWTVNSKAIQLYGQVRVSVDSVNDDTKKNDGTDINSNASRLGVKGEFDSTLPEVRPRFV